MSATCTINICSPHCGSSSQAHYDLKIPKEHHRFIIGREGAKLHSIELSTATKISVPRSEDASEVVKIVGTKEGVDKARHQIQVISDEQVKCMYCVPLWHGSDLETNMEILFMCNVHVAPIRPSFRN